MEWVVWLVAIGGIAAVLWFGVKARSYFRHEIDRAKRIRRSRRGDR